MPICVAFTHTDNRSSFAMEWHCRELIRHTQRFFNWKTSENKTNPETVSLIECSHSDTMQGAVCKVVGISSSHFAREYWQTRLLRGPLPQAPVGRTRRTPGREGKSKGGWETALRSRWWLGLPHHCITRAAAAACRALDQSGEKAANAFLGSKLACRQDEFMALSGGERQEAAQTKGGNCFSGLGVIVMKHAQFLPFYNDD